jgi:hypothetical protein
MPLKPNTRKTSAAALSIAGYVIPSAGIKTKRKDHMSDVSVVKPWVPDLGSIAVQRVFPNGITYGVTAVQSRDGEKCRYWSWNRCKRPVEITEIDSATFFGSAPK